MSLSTLPLSYCTNVHPAKTVAEVEAGLDQYTVPVKQNYGQPLAAGLWLANSVIQELKSSPQAVQKFVAGIQSRGLSCHTLNAFPYGDFHSERVKEQVYLPDWTSPDRLRYTFDCAQVLAALLPDGTEGSISTVPFGFSMFDHATDFYDRCFDQLIELSRQLDDLHDESGRCIRLAIEPEPFCLLEMTEEQVLPVFEKLRSRADDAGALDIVNRHIGLCYDVCHQAVEFEDIPKSIGAINSAGIRINKVHITCAIHIDNPAENLEAREALAQYVEPRYMHQTMALAADGEVLRIPDLTTDVVLNSDDDSPFLNATAWRVHYHVPVDAESLGPLGTTRGELKSALKTVADLEYAPHLEVETYTWEVLPDGNSTNLVDGLTNELVATKNLLDNLQGGGKPPQLKIV